MSKKLFKISIFTRKSQRKLYFVPIAGIFLLFLTFATLNRNNICKKFFRASRRTFFSNIISI